MHQWQLLLLLLCVHAKTEMRHRCPSRAATRECFVFFKEKKKNYADPGEGRKQMGCHSDCKMSSASKYLKESKTEEKENQESYF